MSNKENQRTARTHTMFNICVKVFEARCFMLVLYVFIAFPSPRSTPRVCDSAKNIFSDDRLTPVMRSSTGLTLAYASLQDLYPGGR